MQRHFSNRGEALAEVAAAKNMAGRKHSGKPVLATRSDKRVPSGKWQPPVSEVIRSTGPAKKKEPKASAKPSLGPPEF